MINKLSDSEKKYIKELIWFGRYYRSWINKDCKEESQYSQGAYFATRMALKSFLTLKGIFGKIK